MYEREYKELVLAEFDLQKEARLLPPELLSPTPGGLKSLSVDICNSRPDPKDEMILQSVFGKKEDINAYRLLIQNDPPDPFRPLVTFLKDRTVNTSLRNVNLLAWFINFQPRPFHPDLEIPVKPITVKPVPINHPKPPVPPSKPVGITKRKVVIAAVLLLIISSIGYYLLQEENPHITGKEGCMVWENDHYLPIDCKTANLDKPSYPIDHQLVANFKRIMKPDTLTPYSIKRTWYAKYNGQVYFFTADGPFPLDTNRRLLLLSAHILNTHVYHIKN